VPQWLNQLLPILVLLAAIGLVLMRLPRVDLGHSEAFRRRRFLNWFPLGLTYAFLYFGRYNLNVATTAMGDRFSNADFGSMFAWGAGVYGVAFFLNGPLTDILGGRATILLSAAGAAVSNALMGLLVWGVLAHGWTPPGGLVGALTVLFAVNMYFQSFGAVSIVKVNASWFHVRERGVQGGVFGILISLGLYFAFDWSRLIVQNVPVWWAFGVPAALLAVFFFVDLALIRNAPSDTGHADFDTADASSGAAADKGGSWGVLGRMMRNPVFITILVIEFCSGFLRNAVMQWYPKYGKAVGIDGSFVVANWGMLSCVAGILGGMFAGIISDRVFDSRRGPVSAVLYGGLVLGTGATFFLLGHPLLGWVAVFMSVCFIGVHGMLSGTATADFGGKKNAGVATGIIDGAVYAGTTLQSVLLGSVLPSGALAKDPHAWSSWPWAMLPLSVLGFVLATRLWNAKPNAAPAAAPAPVALAGAASAPDAASRRTGS
jgi:OPA family glycerol-3-phosphate transporter-like MFS transporter